MKKSVLAIALAVLMAVSLLTVGAMAAGDVTQKESSVAKYENADGGTTYFDTVGEAISAANAGGGGTITLLDNAELKADDVSEPYKYSDGYGDGVYVDKALTLDLGGYILTCNEFWGLDVTPYASLTIKRGTYEHKGGISYGYTGSAIQANKVKDAGPGCTITIESDATVKTDGDAVLCQGYNNVYVNGKIYCFKNGIFGMGPCNNVTLDGAYIESDTYAVYQNPYTTTLTFERKGSVYNIKNSTIIADDEQPGVFLFNYKESTSSNHVLNIENSSISAGIGVYMVFTDATISGDSTKIISTNEAGNAIFFGHDGYDDIPGGTVGTLNIKAGTFVGPINEEKPNGDAENEAIVIVSGGEFDRPVDTEYLADDLNFELYSDNMYTYHKSMDEALKNAEPGDTITEVGAGTPAMEVYTVTLAYGNGQNDVTTLVQDGGTITLPTPTNSGYIFLGWRDNNNVTHKAGDVVPITADTTFVAVWGNLPDVKPSEPSEPETPVFPFYDVTARDWYYSAVKYVYEKGLMDGVDVGVFAPNDTLTRAMVWTIIARAEGVDTTGGATWYAKAQEWVTAKGISDGENPTAAITRQELVTMLYRLAGEPAVSGTITAPDAASVSTWATDAMTWAMNIGLVEGDENGAVTPTATATRAQAAALIMRYLEA